MSPWPENDELAALGAAAEQALAAEDDRRGERPGDRLGVRTRSRRARAPRPGSSSGRVQSRRPACSASAATLTRHGGGAPAGTPPPRAALAARRRARRRTALAAPLAPLVGSGTRATGAAPPRRRLGGEQQVDTPRGVARRDDVRRVDVDLLQAHQPLERAQLVDLHLDVADLQQVVRRRVDDFDAARADDAGDLERQLRPLLEGDDEVGVQRRRAQLRRQAARQVAEVGRDREAVELQVQLAVAALGERRRRAGRIEVAAVEREGEVRLDLDLALGRQRADERNRRARGSRTRCVVASGRSTKSAPPP